MKKSINEKPAAKAGAKEPRSKRCEEAFKRQAVEHWQPSGKPGTQSARELGVSYPPLKQWKRCYWGDAMPARPDLEGEVRAQRDILKKTLGI